MGKGDQRTKRGKIFAGSFGKTRPHKKKKKNVKPQQSKETTKTESSNSEA
jgi:30S ribosomal protein S31